MNPAIPAVSACDSNPCQNGAVCNGNADGFACNCPSGFEGVFCENRRGKTSVSKFDNNHRKLLQRGPGIL